MLLDAAVISFTATSLIIVFLLHDWWGLAIFSMLLIFRLLNCLVIRARSASPGWKGAPEPDVRGDLLILLSQDRWIRMQGLVDDLKVVTSGSWLRNTTFFEDAAVSAATLLVYIAAALAGNASLPSKMILVVLLTVSVGMLAVSNKLVTALPINGCIVTRRGEPKKYARRLDLARQLIKESGREDWALRLGMIVASDTEQTPKGGDVKRASTGFAVEEVTM